MKRCIYLALVAILACFMLMAAFGTGKAYASDGKGHTSHHNSSTPNFTSGDPYSTGCANGVNSPAATGSISAGGYTVHIENWYSSKCNANWGRIYWSGGTAVQTFVEIFVPNTGDKQCYPTSCTGYYTGGKSPSWTDMVDGTYQACVQVNIKAGGKSNNSYGTCA